MESMHLTAHKRHNKTLKATSMSHAYFCYCRLRHSSPQSSQVKDVTCNFCVNSFFSSRADDDFSGPIDTNVRLRYNGEITWDAPAITKSSCVVDVSYFPFDSQECNLTFGSWTYNGNQVCSLLTRCPPFQDDDLRHLHTEYQLH